MALQTGTSLGPYKILELAGAGGVGEVYKARDTRLDRAVAIKVLPPHASAVSDLKQRFEREAQTIGSLKHPNICVLHDIGSEGGVDFIVMEYLQGETLAERIAREKGREVGRDGGGQRHAWKRQQRRESGGAVRQPDRDTGHRPPAKARGSARHCHSDRRRARPGASARRGSSRSETGKRDAGAVQWQLGLRRARQAA